MLWSIQTIGPYRISRLLVKKRKSTRKVATDDAYLIIPDSHQLHHSIKSRNPIIHVFPFVMVIRHNFFLFVKNVWDKFVT